MGFKDSALYWLPRIEKIDGLNIPTTKIIELTEDMKILMVANEFTFLEEYGLDFEREFRKFNFPVFIRTDEMSRKHEWNKTCFVNSLGNFFPNMFCLVSDNIRCGEECRAILIREFIPLEHHFTHFGAMPVARERRYFIDDGKVVCHHPYWDEIAFECNLNDHDLNRLNEINSETEIEIEELTRMAQLVANEFEGSWSVDFAQAETGRWFLIDMATAENSWHPEDCEFGYQISK